MSDLHVQQPQYLRNSSSRYLCVLFLNHTQPQVLCAKGPSGTNNNHPEATPTVPVSCLLVKGYPQLDTPLRKVIILIKGCHLLRCVLIRLYQVKHHLATLLGCRLQCKFHLPMQARPNQV